MWEDLPEVEKSGLPAEEERTKEEEGWEVAKEGAPILCALVWLELASFDTSGCEGA